MKSIQRILSLLVILSATVFFASCDNGGDPQKSEKQVQIDALVGTWKSSSTVHNSNSVSEFSDFVVTLSQAGTAESLTFTTSGRPASPPSPWPASGTITFGTPVTTAFLFGDAATATYAVSGNSLSITFSGYSAPGYTGRVNSAAGDWVFSFTKQ